jgi:hypothetical protein
VEPDGGHVAHVRRHVVAVFDDQLRRIHEIPMPYPCAVEFSPAGDLLAAGDWGKAGIVIAWPP